jgi:hypothetical protein
MTFEEFHRSLEQDEPPDSLSPALVALWHDGRGDWDRAHETAQDIEDKTGSWVHAYLHRKEGDEGNARYWYHRAGVTPASGPLETEWRVIVDALLATRR